MSKLNLSFLVSGIQIGKCFCSNVICVPGKNFMFSKIVHLKEAEYVRKIVV